MLLTNMKLYDELFSGDSSVSYFTEQLQKWAMINIDRDSNLLFAAITNKCENLAIALIKTGAKVTWRIQNKTAWSAALFYGRQHVLAELARCDNLNIPDLINERCMDKESKWLGHTALQITACNPFESLNNIRSLLKKGGDPFMIIDDPQNSNHGMNACQIFLSRSSVEIIIAIADFFYSDNKIEQAEKAINQVGIANSDFFGFTVLHSLIAYGQWVDAEKLLPNIEKCIQFGANTTELLTQGEFVGMNAWHLAVIHNRHDIIETMTTFLCENAQATRKKFDLTRILTVPSQHIKYNRLDTIKMASIENKEIMMRLLRLAAKHHPFAVTTLKHSLDILHYCVLERRIDILRIILESNEIEINIDMKTTPAQPEPPLTPLALACILFEKMKEMQYSSQKKSYENYEQSLIILDRCIELLLLHGSNVLLIKNITSLKSYTFESLKERQLQLYKSTITGIMKNLFQLELASSTLPLHIYYSVIELTAHASGMKDEIYYEINNKKRLYPLIEACTATSKPSALFRTNEIVIMAYRKFRHSTSIKNYSSFFQHEQEKNNIKVLNESLNKAFTMSSINPYTISFSARTRLVNEIAQSLLQEYQKNVALTTNQREEQLSEMVKKIQCETNDQDDSNSKKHTDIQSILLEVANAVLQRFRETNIFFNYVNYNKDSKDIKDRIYETLLKHTLELTPLLQENTNKENVKSLAEKLSQDNTFSIGTIDKNITTWITTKKDTAVTSTASQKRKR